LWQFRIQEDIGFTGDIECLFFCFFFAQRAIFLLGGNVSTLLARCVGWYYGNDLVLPDEKVRQ
jgi:hypothetical protein